MWENLPYILMGKILEKTLNISDSIKDIHILDDVVNVMVELNILMFFKNLKLNFQESE